MSNEMSTLFAVSKSKIAEHLDVRFVIFKVVRRYKSGGN
ncbi:hypothetical protein GKC33_12440 [Lactobacillus salivarius]|uniref:Uncharacterized protein n=1 Tax=Ligilactobacillus salivarius TaxID=1624 RepID=A0A6A8LTN2_9LACO|nr:hypothetical protein [Ligilactobacillus salivarius]MSE09454.1 hypothetical protein [Ligilactobacillus salivarius]